MTTTRLDRVMKSQRFIRVTNFAVTFTFVSSLCLFVLGML
jgi:hypothetical protein